MTPLHSPGPKIRVGENSVQLPFAGAEFYSQFRPKIRCHGNRGRQRRNL